MTIPEMRLPEVRQVTALLELIRSVRDSGPDVIESRKRLMSGLKELAYADAAEWREPHVSALRVGETGGQPFNLLQLTLGPHELALQKIEPFSSGAESLVKLLADHTWMLKGLPALDVSADALSPRLRQTHRLLLEGASEKQIALALGISSHTVHDYVKAVYRRFNVSSRSKLFAQALRVPVAVGAAAS